MANTGLAKTRLLTEFGWDYTPTNNDQNAMKNMNEYDRGQFLLEKQTEFARQAERNHTLISQHEARSGPYEETIYNKTKMENMTNREKEAYLKKQRLASAIKARNRMIAAQNNVRRPRTAREEERGELFRLAAEIEKTDVNFTQAIMSQIDDSSLFKYLIIDNKISNLKVEDNKFKFIQEYLRLRFKSKTVPTGDVEYFVYHILLELSEISNKDELDALKQERDSNIRQYNYLLTDSSKKSTGLAASIKGFFSKKGGSQKARRQTQRQRRQRKQKKTRKRFHK